MISNKKGLSDIVTNVLIILLVLVAVGIVWAVVQPFLKNTSSALTGADQCLTVNVEPVSCDDSTNTVIVKRNAGKGDVVAVGIQIIDPTTKEVTVEEIGGELSELNSVSITSTAATEDKEITAFTKVGPSLGEAKTCDPSPVKITCTA